MTSAKRRRPAASTSLRRSLAEPDSSGGICRSQILGHLPQARLLAVAKREEIDHRSSLCHDFLWGVDPIDGTANFINNFPLFASSIGVLHRGQPRYYISRGAVSLMRTSSPLDAFWPGRGGELARDQPPLRQGGGASFLEGLSVYEMAFQ
ncbi:MAG: inositol monophosphatase family protein [Sphingobium sp.]|nr:inositol monophosphatase family protein [Sphingobium sp.]